MIFSDGYGDFPSVNQADPSGLLAIGASLAKDRLIHAYQCGIFPWYNAGEPIQWFCPKERCVFTPERFHISKSLGKFLKKNPYHITMNQAFPEVIKACSEAARKGQDGETWIHKDMIDTYTQLHYSGMAQSVEVWKDNRLVGGMYGVVIGKIFCGESMFSIEINATKCALLYILESEKFDMIDAQIPNPHLMSMGAYLITREEFIEILKAQKKN